MHLRTRSKGLGQNRCSDHQGTDCLSIVTINIL
jgi:hypothetical protein